MRLFLALACALGPTLGTAEDRPLRMLMHANVLICDSLEQVITSIETNVVQPGCGFTRSSYTVEVFHEVPYKAHELKFELVRFEFPQHEAGTELSTYIQYGFMGRPTSTELKSSVGSST